MNLQVTPEDQSIEVWCFRLDESSEKIDQLVELLPDSEKQMKTRGVVPEIGLRATVARAGLRSILSHYLGIPAPSIRLNIGEHGKPALDGDSIVFNLSPQRISGDGCGRDISQHRCRPGADPYRCSHRRSGGTLLQ